MALAARATALLAALGALAACQALHKRAEMSPMPFVLGSRYGRSPERLISPRNDRFFMGGRYGKRSEPPTSQQEAPAVGAPPARLWGGGPARGAWERDGGPLLCRYTGVLSLYSCVRKTADPHARPLYQRTNGSPASAALSEEQ